MSYLPFSTMHQTNQIQFRYGSLQVSHYRFRFEWKIVHIALFIEGHRQLIHGSIDVLLISKQKQSSARANLMRHQGQSLEASLKEFYSIYKDNKVWKQCKLNIDFRGYLNGLDIEERTVELCLRVFLASTVSSRRSPVGMDWFLEVPPFENEPQVKVAADWVDFWSCHVVLVQWSAAVSYYS